MQDGKMRTLLNEKHGGAAGADPGYVKRGGRDPKGGHEWLI